MMFSCLPVHLWATHGDKSVKQNRCHWKYKSLNIHMLHVFSFEGLVLKSLHLFSYHCIICFSLNHIALDYLYSDLALHKLHLPT